MPTNLDRFSTKYVTSVLWEDHETKVRELQQILEDNSNKVRDSRKLRYAEIDVEAERESGRLQPDELYVPVHTIESNIRREQTPYVQYVTQSARAVIVKDREDPAFDLSLLEVDLSERLRYDGWQLSMFANIDSFQMYGYSVMEVIQDTDNPGGLRHEMVQNGDFAFISDTRNIQSVERTGRAHYFTRTKLLSMCGDPLAPKESDWSRDQVDKVLSKDPSTAYIDSADPRDLSMYKIIKVMFRIRGVVHVAWASPETCDDWLRAPRPLFIGRRKPKEVTPLLGGLRTMLNMEPVSEEMYETEYPYVLFPYLISENDTISHLKGRVFLDQDLQEAVSSLLSSTVTKARRSAGLYFSKQDSDPNDDVLQQKNIFFKSGCLINSKVQEFQLQPPDPGMFSAIQLLVASNQNETSQVNFAVNNRKDSRKTAKEIDTAEKQQANLSTVQVVLFSIALTQLYRKMSSIIKSRVAVGLIKVNPTVQQLYARDWTVKPSGDVDVIEKQQTLQKMMNAWPIIGNTAAANVFLIDMLEMMFPDRAPKYIQAINQAIQMQQSQQAMQMQSMTNMLMQLAQGIINLAGHQEFFSDSGKLHAFPVVEQTAEQLKQLIKGQQNGGQQRQPTAGQ